MATVKIENWSVVFEQADPYKPPERRRSCLLGNVYDHPSHHHPDGKLVVTSRIVETFGDRVKTKSGNLYVLGKPDPGYAAWLKNNHPHIDLACPFPKD